jgi:hypothetical protein
VRWWRKDLKKMGPRWGWEDTKRSLFFWVCGQAPECVLHKTALSLLKSQGGEVRGWDLRGGSGGGVALAVGALVSEKVEGKEEVTSDLSPSPGQSPRFKCLRASPLDSSDWELDFIPRFL